VSPWRLLCTPSEGPNGDAAALANLLAGEEQRAAAGERASERFFLGLPPYQIRYAQHAAAVYTGSLAGRSASVFCDSAVTHMGKRIYQV
jgi:hypothetical protein